MKADGTLTGDGVVGTVMSNRAFESYLKGHGLEPHRCASAITYSRDDAPDRDQSWR